MDLRAYQSGASATPPTAPSSPSIGYPTEGSPGTTPASQPGAYWFHQLAEELRAIQVAAGVTPDKSTLNQLLTALQALFAAKSGATSQAFQAADGASGKQVVNISQFGAIFGTSGKQYLPGGHLFQWGRTTFSSGTDSLTVPVVFNSTFPVEAYFAFGISSAASGLVVEQNVLTASGATFKLSQRDSSAYNAGTLYFFTLGR